MEKSVAILALVLAVFIASPTLLGDKDENVWTFVGNESTNTLTSLSPDELPSRYSIFHLDEAALHRKLSQAGILGHLHMPSPEGVLVEFKFSNSNMMHRDLAALYPKIKTFKGKSIKNEQDIRFDTSDTGFRGQVLSPGGVYYISPLNSESYIVYYAKYYKPEGEFNCTNHEEALELGPENPLFPLFRYGGINRTYRLAVAATGEYTAAAGGTKESALSSIATAFNFINGIYGREVGVELQLIANNSNIIYTDPNVDPFTPESGSITVLAQNQTNTDQVIGSANYDIGHIVHALAGGGNFGSGVASLSSTCRTTSKARGLSSASRIGLLPMNPSFYRIIAHELGHQFGANHSFNSSCNGNRNGATAYEPGSGSTIMSYAGGCSPFNIQSLADTYFHRISLEEISTFLVGTGSTCGAVTNTGNAAPFAQAGSSYNIPRSTPFVLRGIGLDFNGDTLLYDWEQFNNEIATMPPLATSTVGPNFRSFPPTTSPLRYFPRLADILANTTPLWEVLPSVSRTMNFSLVVRDKEGGVASDNTDVTIVGTSGPFIVTSPNGGETGVGSIIVTWDPANTTLAPINATFVDILLSTDNGNSFPFLLVNNTPNDGSQTVVLPNIVTTNARIQVKADSNIFFDVSNGPFSIAQQNN